MNLRDVLNKFLARKGSKIERSMPVIYRDNIEFRADFDFIFQYEIYRNNGKFNFIQIGANDGVSRSDDIFEYIQHFDAEGIMLEPQLDVYEKLKNNFSAYPKIKPLNKAIHTTEKKIALYSIDNKSIENIKDLPLWASTSGTASFDKLHVLEHAKRINLSEDEINGYDVECITLAELFAMCPFKRIDLLKVDTEGYDFEVLKMLRLDEIMPTIIRFEHLHMSRLEYEETIKKLSSHRYRFIADKMNTTAYRYCSPLENLNK